MKTAPVTIVIPHRNRVDEILRSLKSLQTFQTVPQEVIIVDDFSYPDQQRLLRDILSKFKNINIKLFCFSKHVGTSDAKNLGLFNTRTPYIWFLDSDTEIISTDTLEVGCQILDKNPDVGVVGTEIIKGRHNQRYIREQYLLKTFWSAYIYHPVTKVFRKEVDFISTCNFLTRTKILEKIGGFHSLLENGEDKLACIQIQKLNYKILLDTRFAVLHHQSPTSREDFLTRVRIQFRDVAFIYGTVSSIWKLAAFHVNCVLSMLEYYKHITKNYRLYGNPSAINSKDTLDTSRSFKLLNLINRLINIVKVIIHYILANKTYMFLKGYYLNKKNKKDLKTIKIHLSKLCNEINL